jgi:prolyl oligopeptidase
MTSASRAGAVLPAVFAIASAAHGSDPSYPPAAKEPVTHTYHGVTVVDNYQWLENGDAPAVKGWVAAENALSRAWLEAVPGRDAVHARVETLITSSSSDYYDIIARGGRLFALERRPPKQQPLLVRLDSADAPQHEHVVVDPNLLAADGSIAIDFYEPSLDGRKVAVSLSAHGSEDGTLHVFDAATGKDLGDTVARAAYPTGGGSVAWNREGTGFHYTRYPAPGERDDADLHFYQQVWFHELGRAADHDTYSAGADFPRIAETRLDSSPDGRYVTALVANGDGGDYSLYLESGGKWRKIAADSDGVKSARFGGDGWLYLESRKDAPRGKIVRVRLADPELSRAELVLPEGEGTIEHFECAGDMLYTSLIEGGPSRLLALDLGTKRSTGIALPPVSAVADLAHDANGGMLARVTSYLEPPAWYRIVGAHSAQKTALAVTSSADYRDTEVLRAFAVSKDGTRIPLNIIRRKGTPLDGNNPTILNGYGGFGISMTPWFSSSLRVWLDHGGMYVIANLRGGGEYGEAWHHAGARTHKQTVFDDFIAAAEYLIRQRYTRPERLAIRGGSNGGLLMGAVLTQRPALFRAVSSDVGIYDMLRVELDPNGAFNVTEYGSVKDPRQFEALYAYSPYHHVKDGTDYPAVLMTTGDHDGRVNPAHSRKMIARLQAADPHGRPILLRTSATSGHGIGTALSEIIDQITDDYCFFFHELGVDLTRK